MAWAGNTFSRIYNWVADAAAGVPITASRFDTDTDDIVSSLTVAMQYATLTASGAIPVGVGTIFVNAGSAVALTLPAAQYGANAVRVIDKSGAAGTNNITITPATGTISGQASYVINQNYGAATFAFDGTNWEVGSEVIAPTYDRYYLAASGAPAGTTSLTGVMMGTGAEFELTPSKSGNYLITYAGTIANNTQPNGGALQLRYGTGAAPANGAALTGTALVSSAAYAAINNQATVFSMTRYLPGLSVGTTYWLDVSLAALVGGTASVAGVYVSVVEL